jgi:hypothetical protein
MIHRSGSGYWIQFEKGFRSYTFLGGKADHLFLEESGSAYFWCQNGAFLWMADLSFRNSVTGCGSRAKYSNIQQETFADECIFMTNFGQIKSAFTDVLQLYRIEPSFTFPTEFPFKG